MAAVILTAVLSCSTPLSISPRAYSSCREPRRCARALVRTNRRHVPARAVLLASAFGFVGVIAAILSPAGVFKFLVNASGGRHRDHLSHDRRVQVCSRRARERAGLPPSALPMWLFPGSAISPSREWLGDHCDGVHAVAPCGILDQHGLHRSRAASRTWVPAPSDAALPSAESSPAQSR